MKQAGLSALVAGCVWLAGCTGQLTDSGAGAGNSGTGATPGAGGGGAAAPGTGGTAGTDPGAGATAGAAGSINPDPTDPIEPFEAVSVRSYLRKIKNILTGLAPTESEVQTVLAAPDEPSKQAALRGLIDTWADPASPQFREKMIFFFRNAFQQTGFTPTEDFKLQLLENAGFDLGPVGLYGDDAFPKLVQNLQDSFARTALEILVQGRPFTEVLTTRQYMMTTALMSLYIQVEMPNDQPFARFGQQGGTPALAWSVDMTVGGTNGDPTDADRVAVAHPIEDVVNPASPSYLVFDDRAPVMAGGSIRFGGACDMTKPLGQGRGCCPEIKTEAGYSLLFQRLFGFTPRTPFSGNIDCGEHGSLPYYSASDLGDWRMVTLTDGVNHPEMFDLPALRQATTLGLGMQRVGFYTTPAYLALWNTNDSNQHRVTANQTLLIALGQSVMGAGDIVPINTAGLDPAHAVENTECYSCHSILDPMRQFWANQFDYNDRNDFPARVFGGIANPRPATTGGVLAFSNVNTAGASIADLGTLLGQVVDANAATPDQPVNRFALSFAQKLCFFADSAGCSEDDPEFRRVVLAFQNDNFNFRTLIRELLSSPLVTGAANTLTFSRRNALVSVSRRDQLCQALSNRLGVADLCALSVAFPFQQGFGGGGAATALSTQRAIFRIAGALPADAFSRGSESPVTSPEPTLFYRAASELVCENIATLVVDVTGSRYQSADLEGAMVDMTQSVMGYATGDPHYAEALQILHDNYAESTAAGRSATDSLRSTFALACQSPTSVSFGI